MTCKGKKIDHWQAGFLVTTGWQHCPPLRVVITVWSKITYKIKLYEHIITSLLFWMIHFSLFPQGWTNMHHRCTICLDRMVKPQTTKLSSVVMFLAKKCSSKTLKPLAFLENNSSFSHEPMCCSAKCMNMRTVISPWQRANARNVSFKTLYGGQFTLSTQLIILNNRSILSHRRSTTISLETS